jgi:hypothetical protein
LKNLLTIIFGFKKHEFFCEAMQIFDFFLNIWGEWSEQEPELEPEPGLKFLYKLNPEPPKNGPAQQHCLLPCDSAAWCTTHFTLILQLLYATANQRRYTNNATYMQVWRSRTSGSLR